jgi:hypothetical protein
MFFMAHNQLQQKCWIYLWNTYPETRYSCWHTKNESIPGRNETKKEYIIRVSQDKAVGLLPGVWDLTMYWKGVLYIFDIKVGKDKLSEQQCRFRDATLKNGGCAFIIPDFDTFTSTIEKIMG